MTDQLYIGIDSGTQGAKAVVLSAVSGNILAVSYQSYAMIENGKGGREQHPKSWIRACRKILSDVLATPEVSPAEVRAIGVSGQQHGMVPLDSNGHVIRPAKLWCDTETFNQCQTITQRVGGESAVLEKIGNHIAVGFTASKILWMQENEPENFEKMETVLLPHDYINFWLTGEKATEYGDASGTAYFDVVNRTWSQDMLQAIDPSGRLKACLPTLKKSVEPVGTLRKELTKELGLPDSVLVSSGGGDNMMAAIGTGNVSEGVVTASFGTSGTIYAYSANPVVDKNGEIAAFCSSTGGWLPLICTMNVTVATELARNLFDLSIDEMNRLAMQVEPGAAGLILLPYFNGERTPALPTATATLAGLTGLNMRTDAICRASMEGATFSLRYGLDLIRRNGINPQEFRLTGGGAKSKLWRQIAADVFNGEVVCLAHEEAGATGAALQALWCDMNYFGRTISIEEVTRRYVKLDPKRRHLPTSPAVERYDEIYQKYLALNDALGSTYTVN